VTPEFVVRPEAEADIDEAYEWYERRSLGLGDRFLDAVEEAIGFVRESPQRFPAMHREPDMTIRRALVDRFPYGVFFIWDETANATSVIACMHARQDPRRWLRRA
jgi:plasmid stabilization system protein ParE